MRITFEGKVPVEHDELMRHVALSKKRGLPSVREQPRNDRTLAVVGGGPSIRDHVEEIRNHLDVWAINGACGWLRDQGIESTLLCVDPCDFLAQRVKGARKALLASRCHPAVFEALRGCDITLWDVLQDTGEGIWGSVSAVMSVFHLAPLYGFRKAVFYGVEGSYAMSTHAYMNDPECSDYAFVVAVGGEEYLTAPDLYMQTLELSKL